MVPQKMGKTGKALLRPGSTAPSVLRCKKLGNRKELRLLLPERLGELLTNHRLSMCQCLML